MCLLHHLFLDEEFPNHHLKLVIKNGWSYIKWLVKILDSPILLTADVARLYHNISHNSGSKTLNNMLQVMEHSAASAEGLVKMARSVLETNYFEFNGNDVKQISGTAVATNFCNVLRVYIY